MRIYSLTIKNRLSAIALGVGVVGVGVLLVFVGFALLAALTVAGAVLGTGFATYRWLRGGRGELPHTRDVGLDPALEVRPRTQPIAPPGERTDDPNSSPPVA